MGEFAVQMEQLEQQLRGVSNLETVKVMLREQYMKNLRVLPMLQTKVTEWEKEKQELESRIVMANGLQIDAANREAVATANYNKLVGVSKQLQQEYVALKQQSAAHSTQQAENQRLNEMVNRLTAERLATQTQIDGFKSREAQCRDMMLKLTQEVAKLKAAAPAQTSQAVELVTQMYEQKLATARTNASQEIEGLQQKLRSFQDNSKSEKGDLSEKIADLETQNKKLEEQKIKQAAEHQATLTSLQSYYEDQIADVNKSKLSSMQEYEGRITELDTKLQASTLELSSFKNSSETQEKENQSLAKKLEKLKAENAEIAVVKKKNLELEEKLKSSQATKTSVDDISTQLDKTRVDLKMAETQLANAKKDLEKTKKKEKDLKAQTKKLQGQVQEQATELATLSANNQKLQKEVEAKTAENQQILSERTRALSARAQEIVEINKVKAEAVASSESEIASLRTKFEKKQKEYNQLRESTNTEIANLKSEIKKLTKDAQSTQETTKTIDALKLENKTLTEKYDKLKSDSQKLQSAPTSALDSAKEKEYLEKIKLLETKLEQFQKEGSEFLWEHYYDLIGLSDLPAPPTPTPSPVPKPKIHPLSGPVIARPTLTLQPPQFNGKAPVASKEAAAPKEVTILSPTSPKKGQRPEGHYTASSDPGTPTSPKARDDERRESADKIGALPSPGSSGRLKPVSKRSSSRAKSQVLSKNEIDAHFSSAKKEKPTSSPKPAGAHSSGSSKKPTNEVNDLVALLNGSPKRDDRKQHRSHSKEPKSSGSDRKSPRPAPAETSKAPEADISALVEMLTDNTFHQPYDNSDVFREAKKAPVNVNVDVVPHVALDPTDPPVSVPVLSSGQDETFDLDKVMAFLDNLVN